MNGLKIGVLTFHRCINYGSYWQARCLAGGLALRGHNATILDHHSRSVNIAEWKCALQPVLPTPVPASDVPLYKEKIHRFFEAFKTLPLSAPFPLHNPDQMEAFDVVVVGSDEVWNLFHPWYSNCPLFYGEGINAQHLVAYAASFGNQPSAWQLDTAWAEKLSNFDVISVRDENSRQHIQQALQFSPEIVLDPCLQFDLQYEAQENGHLPEQYVAVYGHNFSEPFIAEVQRFAREQKQPLVSIGYRNDWADEQWLTAGPHQFAQFMNEATAVATNFFHGCVFALRNDKPFVCETSSYRSFKVQGLMETLGSTAHLVHPDTPSSVYNRLLSEPLHPAVAENIARLRQHSHAFLDRALDVKQQLQVA